MSSFAVPSCSSATSEGSASAVGGPTSTQAPSPSDSSPSHDDPPGCQTTEANRLEESGVSESKYYSSAQTDRSRLTLSTSDA